MWDIFATCLFKHQAGEVREFLYELKQVRDVVGDGGSVGVHTLQVLLIDLAHTFQTLIDGLIVAVGASLGLAAGLHQQDGVGHFEH